MAFTDIQPVKTGKNWPPAIRQKAFELYVQGYVLKEIETETGVPYDTLCGWRRKHGWVETVKKLETESARQFQAECMKLVQKEKPEVMQRQLKLARKLHGHTEAILDDNEQKVPDTATGLERIISSLDPESLAHLARVLKSASDVESRVVGIGKPEQESNTHFHGPVQINVNPIGNEAEPALPALEAEYEEEPDF